MLSQVSSEAQERLRTALRASGANAEVAEACSKLFTTQEEAQKYVGSADDNGNGFKSPWKEYYSLRYRRFYFVNDINGNNVWDMPKPLQLQQWILDSDMFKIDIGIARALLKRILSFCDQYWHVPDQLWDCLELLSKIIGNVVMCNNSVEKYRSVKMINPKVVEKILALVLATDILEAAGFIRSSEAFTFPDVVTPLMMSAASLVASRLQQLCDKRGFTGDAKPADDPAKGGTTKQSKWHGTPGFRYQTDIYECSLCSAPINDGSERVFSRAHDAPKGQFRYECQDAACLDSGGFNLCEQCWDVHNQQGLHPPSHTFRTHHPHASRHFMFSQETDNNPWGVPVGGGSAARARERLRQRHGM